MNRVKLDWFSIVLNKTKYKTFFGLIWNGSETDSRMPWNSSDPIRLNSNQKLPLGQSNSIRTNPNQVFNPTKYDFIVIYTEFSIQTSLTSDSFKMFWIESDKVGLFHKTRYKTFFGLVWNGSETDFQMPWNSSDPIRLNSNQKLPLGQSSSIRTNPNQVFSPTKYDFIVFYLYTEFSIQIKQNTTS